MRNVPRIRDVDAMLAILEALGVSVEWRGANELALCAADVHEVEIDPELAEQIRASFLLAGPLLARFGRAVMPPPGGDVIGRRRLDPHLDAFRAMGADTRVRPRDRAQRPARPAPDRRVHGRALGDGHRERADGGRADARHDRDRQRRLRAPRAGPRAHAREDGRRHPGHRLEPDHRQRRRAPARLRARRRARPHRDRQLHGARRRDRRRTAHQGHRARRPAHDPAGVRAPRPALGARRRRRDRARRAEARGAGRRRRATRARSRTARGRRSRPT